MCCVTRQETSKNRKELQAASLPQSNNTNAGLSSGDASSYTDNLVLVGRGPI